MLMDNQTARLTGPDNGHLPPASLSRPAAFDVDGLTVRYGDVPAVINARLSVPDGAMMAIVGPNGAGKSTLLKGALGLVPCVSGETRVLGAAYADNQHRLAYVPQRASVDWDFPARVLDVVMMGLYREIGLFRFAGHRHRARAIDCLERVGMADVADRQIGKLSGGQQQRVFLARALAQNADLYILDEPLAGVDAASERAIISTLNGLRSEGSTIVSVHHDLATVPRYFDHVSLVNRGVIASGPVHDVFTAANLDRAYGGQLASSHLSELGLITAQ